MSTQEDQVIKSRRNIYLSGSDQESNYPKNLWKSDVCIYHDGLSHSSHFKHSSNPPSYRGKSREYYKRYEHDEVPVKDNSSSKIRADCLEGGENIRSLTNSELDRLEKKVYNNISQELQTDDSSIVTLESNIKFFKTTVQEIFDNFQANMRDYELYKQKFNDILAKNQSESVADMEDFIKDMIHHIMSSETSISNESNNTDYKKNGVNLNNVTHSGANTIPLCENVKLLESLHSLVEAYRNVDYQTESTPNDKSNGMNSVEKILNIYFSNSQPCVQIKMKDLSEINIQDPNNNSISNYVASAENLKKLAAKKLELKRYIEHQRRVPDREIPVKPSYAKKNIHLNEDFTPNNDAENKSFISRLCGYFCRKFRKNSG